jgi:hypothetical protein
VVLGTALVFVVSLTTLASAQTPNATPWLRTGVGARAAGMGNAFVAIASDATAGFFNPAGLTRIPSWGFSSMLSADMTFDRQFNYLAVAGGFKWGTIGGSWVNAGIKDVPLSNGASEDYMDNYFLLSYANATKKFRWGVNFVIAGRALAGQDDVFAVERRWGIGGDFGAQWDFHPEATFGVMIQSVGLEVAHETTPYNIRAGIGIMPDIIEGFTFPFEIQKTQDVEHIKFRMGGEYAYMFDGSDWGTALRGGVDDGELSLGAGLFFLEKFWIDYAYVTEQQDFLGENHRFSLTGNF